MSGIYKRNAVVVHSPPDFPKEMWAITEIGTRPDIGFHLGIAIAPIVSNHNTRLSHRQRCYFYLRLPALFSTGRCRHAARAFIAPFATLTCVNAQT